MLNGWFQDLRYGFRVLAKRPGFTIIAVITLALGIGANTAMFSIINQVMLRPLPFPTPEQLMRIAYNCSAVDIQDLQQRAQSISSIGGYRPHSFDLTTGPEAERISGAVVTGDLFKTLGARPLLGRLIRPSDDVEGAPNMMVVSESFWRTRMGSDPNVVGKKISVSGAAYTVIGVLASDFQLPRIEAMLYAPIQVASAAEANARGAHTLWAIARLLPNVTQSQAQADLDRIAAQLQKLYPEENTDRTFPLLSLQEFLVRRVRKALWMLLGAVGFVLLIASTNVANLLMAKAGGRKKEMAVRVALGATRTRLIRQLLAEYLLISITGCMAGLFVALWIAHLFSAFPSANLPKFEGLQIDSRLLLFTTGVTLFTGLVFGLLPGLHASHPQVDESLKERSGRSSTSGSSKTRNLLVVVEVCLALVLLTGAGLLIRSFYMLRNVDPGFDHKNLLTFNISLPLAQWGEIPRRTEYFNKVLERLQAMPEVQSAGAVVEMPFGSGHVPHNFVISGRPPIAPGAEPEIFSRGTSVDYFKTMRIPIRAGRGFSKQDGANSEPVAIINEAAARTHFPGENPIGKKIKWARAENGVWMTIVGVVADVKTYDLATGEMPALYYPFSQEAMFWKTWMYVVVRPKTEAGLLAAPVRKALSQIDRNIPAAEMATMEELMADSVSDRKFQLTLLGFFAGLALVLSALGIYGVVSHLVTQRTHEMGVRVALGAGRNDILKLILSQGMRLTMLGLGAGMIASIALTRILKSMLFGITPTDIPTLIGVSLVLTIVALLACYIPARRATRLDPVAVLRYE